MKKAVTVGLSDFKANMRQMTDTLLADGIPIVVFKNNKPAFTVTPFKNGDGSGIFSWPLAEDDEDELLALKAMLETRSAFDNPSSGDDLKNAARAILDERYESLAEAFDGN